MMRSTIGCALLLILLPREPWAKTQKRMDMSQPDSAEEYPDPVVVGEIESEAFLERNREKDGVIELPSGLQYKILKNGTGQYVPFFNLSECKAHYRGTLIDGYEFDTSYGGEPLEFVPNNVIRGWAQAIMMMSVGDKWELYIPSHLGYGPEGRPPEVPGGAALIFEVEMIAIIGKSKPKPLPAPPPKPRRRYSDDDDEPRQRGRAMAHRRRTEQAERESKKDDL
eukprot:gnl/TRDRNA2_/TRDRNA2_194539_c0_seq1.p1 gnl/TRDRNA2_/TRDRNA2_194539_c0~~gnl/TRDRNA2_/TRDRNA2_194539_c0_seq1.p1  ORF type:complete len:224 (+),score=40.91 gnl/TRDRNA2_/TRDRNA2_194539_c0_seq1:60-731(+)